MTILIPLGPKDSIDEVVKNTSAPYLIAKDGVFLNRKTHLGTALIKQYKMPDMLGSVGERGVFFWEANPVPAELCAKIYDFFKRIYDKYQTEAEVILTADYQTKEWKAFIPTQKVTGSSVNSVFDPEHIARRHLIVGTMHSHCNMGAFHSGTDINDASDLDGIHFTIGHLGHEKPQIAVMVMMNKIQFNYEPEEVSDFSKIGEFQAPEWWDNYVQPQAKPEITPIGLDLFKKFEPVKRMEAPKWTPQPQNKWVPTKVYDISDFQRPTERRDYVWSGDEMWDKYWESQQSKLKNKSEQDRIQEEDDKAVERLLDSTNMLVSLMIDTDLLNDEDVDDMVKDSSATSCRTILLRKLNRVSSVLEDLGVKVTYKLENIKYNANAD